MLRTLSLGAGVQSSTLALMAAVGEIEPPDCAIFADTGWEPKAVYAHLTWLETQLPFPVHRVSAGNFREDAVRLATHGKQGAHGSRAQPPFHMRLKNGDPAMSARQCTRDYKVAPIRRKQRELLGLRPGQRAPRHVAVEVWIGISLDEAHRMKPAQDAWQRNHYPLVEARMTRADCLGWLERHGYPRPPKSACIGCPFHSDEQWLALTPEEFADAVAFEASVQAGGIGFANATPYLHSSLVPLDRVDFSRRDPKRQPDLFGNECEGMCGV